MLVWNNITNAANSSKTPTESCIQLCVDHIYFSAIAEKLATVCYTFIRLRSQYPFPGDVKVAQEDRNCCLIGLMREELINGGFIGNNLETRTRQSLKFGFNEFIAASFGWLREVVAAERLERAGWVKNEESFWRISFSCKQIARD